MKKTLVYATVLIVIAGVLFIGLRGCTFMPWNAKTPDGSMVSVSITEEFGRRLVKSGKVRVKEGDSALDALKEVARVQTDYGGGFVSAINGIKSAANGKRKDWFYYVNGTLSGIGSNQWEARAGDTIWWDLHEWSGRNFIPAVVGAWPQPFTIGYSRKPQRSRVMYGDGMESLARDVGGYLEKNGADVVYSTRVSRREHDGSGPAIVFLSFGQARRIPWVVDALAQPGKNGSFVTIDDEKLVALDSDGQAAPAGNSAQAAVVSTGSGMGDASPVWFVICDGGAGAARVRRLLVSETERLALKVGVAVEANGSVYALPR